MQAEQLKARQHDVASLRAELADLRRLVASHAFEVSNASSAQVAAHRSGFTVQEAHGARPVTSTEAHHSTDAADTTEATDAPASLLQACATSRAAAASVTARLVDTLDEQALRCAVRHWRCWALGSALARAREQAELQATANEQRRATSLHAACSLVQHCTERMHRLTLRSALATWHLCVKRVRCSSHCMVHVQDSDCHGSPFHSAFDMVMPPKLRCGLSS